MVRRIDGCDRSPIPLRLDPRFGSCYGGIERPGLRQCQSPVPYGRLNVFLTTRPTMKSVLFLCLLIACVGVIAPLYGQDLSSLKGQQPFGFHGGLELRGIYYHANGIANRREPFTYLLSGSPTISLYGWSIPFSFAVSKDERSFRQPFNQFGMSPRYKWMTLHA